ncbi:unnamed protein product [Anisakis simplex]|uniref:LOB domain-containing protein n=1 Tax=Anisakis simplex TaxID=6269 RepID=A0A0M3J5W4_ANISI|nr:unnamed protein product [Anisakis simplex]
MIASRTSHFRSVEIYQQKQVELLAQFQRAQTNLAMQQLNYFQFFQQQNSAAASPQQASAVSTQTAQQSSYYNSPPGPAHLIDPVTIPAVSSSQDDSDSPQQQASPTTSIPTKETATSSTTGLRNRSYKSDEIF